MNKSVQTRLSQLYFISFIEGGLVMVTEIAGAKILTPFFGASLYSWASTLSITLLALMTGYYFGGFVTTKPRFSSSDKITWIFFLSGLTVLLMPSLGHYIMEKTISFSFFPGLIISELFFLFLPIFLMGMISPMIIFQVTKKAELSGRSAGNIYAISTSGGILFTLVFGFLIIPHYGISLPLRILGLCVSLIGLILLLKDKLTAKKKPVAIALILVIATLAFRGSKHDEFPPRSNMRLIERSEGLMGELKVVDELTYPPNSKPLYIRKLKTNNILQNSVFTDMPTQSVLPYVNFTRQLIRSIPKKESALLLGLGAGSLYKVLSDQCRSVETVEIDKRIYDFGVKYFGMPQHNNVITDGRYFINVTKKKYDLIMLDVIIGENVPAQLITLESFKRIYQILNDDGTLIIEHGGVNSFTENSLVPSIVKTIQAAGFQVSTFNPIRSKNVGDVMFVVTKTKFDPARVTIEADVLIQPGPLSDYALPVSTFDNSSSHILTDDINNVDVLLKEHYFEVRNQIRKQLAELKSLRNS